ncbi:MAG: NUDIX domain-containing protein [Erythrobacter sp.]
MEKIPTLTGPVLVVAGALLSKERARGRASGDMWLMHRRPFDKHHGGLWEFPGGKVEHAEIPIKALIRELREELGVAVAEKHCEPIGFAEEVEAEVGRAPIVILLYKVSVWAGEPTALEGEGVGWFTAQEIESLAKPPLDSALAARLFEKA